MGQNTMSENQLVMEFLKEYPKAVESMVENAVEKAVAGLVEQGRAEFFDAMKAEIERAVRNECIHNRDAIEGFAGEAIDTLFGRQMASFNRCLLGMHKRVVQVEEICEGYDADWWKRGDEEQDN